MRKILLAGAVTFTLLLSACDSAVILDQDVISDGSDTTDTIDPSTGDDVDPDDVTDPTDNGDVATDTDTDDTSTGDDVDGGTTDPTDNSGDGTTTETPAGPDNSGDGTTTDTPAGPDNSGDLADLISIAEADGNFTTLLTALEAADLRGALSDPNNINTVFAPTDAAFDALGGIGINALFADSEALVNTLLYHVLPDSNDAASLILRAGTEITMFNGSQAALTTEEGQLRINTASVTTADIVASNGIIHVIDSVLIPPADSTEPQEPVATDSIAQLLSNDPQFSTLQLALTTTGLDEALSQDGVFTLFAPTNDAFDAIGEDTLNVLLADPEQLQDLLLYHVVPDTAIDSVAAIAAAGTALVSASSEPLSLSLNGNALNINNATVIEADMVATNGIVHTIDTVLFPPSATAPGTILDVLSGNPDYSELVSLLIRANLTNILNDANSSFTVFAPNNTAIANAEAAGLTSDTAALTALLLGHISGSSLTALELIGIDGADLELVTGPQRISLIRDELFIGDAEIIDPDVVAQNGIIHGIDAVLVPQ